MAAIQRKQDERRERELRPKKFPLAMRQRKSVENLWI
jgi:hypothetical protein